MASTSHFLSPYRSGFPIDAVTHQEMHPEERDKLCLQYQSLVGSLNWLTHTTRPDLLIVVSLLAQHQSHPSPGHYDAALYTVKYLANTKSLGIHFTSQKRNILECFLHFPTKDTLLTMANANWSLQDASKSTTITELEPFVSRSMSTYYIDLLGPLHWSSKCQTVTAGSSAKAVIYVTIECLKFCLHWLSYLIFFKFVIFLCQALTLFTMTTKHVLTGQSVVPPKAYVISK